MDHFGGSKLSGERGDDIPFKNDDGKTPLIKGIIFNFILNLNYRFSTICAHGIKYIPPVLSHKLVPV